MKTNPNPSACGSFRYAFNRSRNSYVAWPFNGSPLTRRGCYDPATVCAEGATAAECLAKLPAGAPRKMVYGSVHDELIDARPATWKEENGRTVIVEPPELNDPETAHLAVIRYGQVVRPATWSK